jgi:hypothetical protein
VLGSVAIPAITTTSTTPLTCNIYPVTLTSLVSSRHLSPPENPVRTRFNLNCILNSKLNLHKVKDGNGR